MKLLHISEKIRDHLIKQNAQSVDQTRCRYRDGVNNMCAVGCLLTDDVYSPDLENKGAGHDLIKTAVKQSLKIDLDYHSIELLKSWQTYHDSAYFSDIHGLSLNYSVWIAQGSLPDSPHSPEVMHNHLVKMSKFDMTGEVTRRYIRQVSNFVAAHLLKQGKQSVNSSDNCQYLSEDGCMCAVGSLINKDQYNTELEGVNLSAPRVRNAVASSLNIDEMEMAYSTPLYDVLRSWQRYHDNHHSTFTKEEIDCRRVKISLMLDDVVLYPNLKD